MLQSSTLRILQNGRTIGTGFLVDEDLAVTCAHVVKGLDNVIDVQITGCEPILSARVLPKYFRDEDHGDICFLRLESLPGEILPLPLGRAKRSAPGNRFLSYGYPTIGAVEGVHAKGEILGLTMEKS